MRFRVFVLGLLCSSVTVGCLPFQNSDLEYDPAILDGEVTTGDAAVVYVDLGVGGCTGTLISPQVVLTAAHCLTGQQNTALRAKFVNNANDAGPTQESTAAAIVDGADMGMFALAAPSTVRPIPYNAQALDGLIGQPLRIVGFGVLGENTVGNRDKRTAVSSLLSVTAGQVRDLRAGEMAASNSSGGTCYGDSGGPYFMTMGGTEHLVGVTSRGNAACGAGEDIAVRTDAHQASIANFIAQNDPSTCAADGRCLPTGCATPDPDCGPGPQTPRTPGGEVGPGTPTTPSAPGQAPAPGSTPGQTPAQGGTPGAVPEVGGCQTSSGSGRPLWFLFASLFVLAVPLRRRR